MEKNFIPDCVPVWDAIPQVTTVYWCFAELMQKLPFLVVTFLNITQNLNTGLYFIQVHLMFPFYFF